jgi:cytochrome c oxidase cbb3-type subunit 3/ubiquinol-cytochrome c reductase cytochrome c subunit
MSTGCKNIPGKPGPEPEVGRPEQLVSFAPLYQQNCAGCHGSEGKNGAAISLANPVYLAIAGKTNIERVTREGVAGTMMPPFGQHAGGMLTDQQISVLAQGMIDTWGHADALAGATAPAYQSASAGDPVQGQKTYTTFCARCHGADGTGIASGKTRPGSLVDPAYLALVSDQGIRSTILAGQPERGMPDWRSDLVGANARPMTEQEITDTVAWLTSHRVATPGQPYPKSE